MATGNGDKTDGCVFRWEIKNIRHCWLKQKQELESPTFIADALGGTEWMLRLYVRGYHEENNIIVYLFKKEDFWGPTEVEVNFQIGFLYKDGLLVGNNYFNIRVTNGVYGPSILRERVFVTEREEFLPNDTLTVKCTIWNGGQTPVNLQKVFARTAFKVNRRSFVWKIDEFSTRKSGQINRFKDEIIDFDVILNEGLDCEKKLAININSSDESMKFFSFKTSIVDIEGGKESCGSHEYFADDLKKGIKCILLLPKKCIENKSRFLPNDVLSLDCEYVCSNGVVEYEHSCCGVLSPKITNEDVKSRNGPDVVKKESLHTAVILDDFKLMYSDGIFSDTELRTSTKTFPAHKAILSARSPVFGRMFSNDMKEKNCGHVDITDFEEDTIHRMLLYMYTDSLDDLQFESALKLFSVADKYEISSLKSKCSSFLKENLCPTNVCDVLLLADLHHDDDLKNCVQDYILEHDKAVFRTQEWKDLMNTHLKLAADIMYTKVYQ